MKLIGVIFALIMAGCTSKVSTGDQTSQSSVEQAKIENITFDAAKKASQTAAEVFDIGTVPVNGTITKTFTLSNLTTSNITLNFTDLQTQLTTNDRFSINLLTATPCGTSLKLNKTCSFDISLKYNATGVQDYTQPILTNIVDPASQGGNTEFGKVMFTGSKASDLTSSAPLAGLIKLNTLSDSFIVPQGGNQTKRFYLGNIGAGNLKAPTIVAPAGGTIATNACVAGATIKPNGTCFFDINYAYVAGASATAQIGFTSTDPLVDMTNLKIQLAITMQAAVVPTVSANFTQVGSIADLTSANQTTRIYVTNNGSATENPLLTTIPAPYVIASTSCTTTLKVGKSCFFDLKIDPTLTTNMDSINSSITLGSTSGSVVAGNTSNNTTTTCKIGFSLVNNKCVTSNVTQSCSISHGVGSQSSTDGGVSFSACAPVSCDQNYGPSANTCAPVACTVQNANISQAASVSGDLVSGCAAQSCVSGFTLIAPSCISDLILAPANQIESIEANYVKTISGKLINLQKNAEEISVNMAVPLSLNMANVKKIVGKINGDSITPTNQNVPDFGTHSCALMNDSTVQCWGLNSYGQLGDGTMHSSGNPVQVVGLSGVKDIVIPDYDIGTTYALMNDGTVMVWGYSYYVGLGQNLTPTLIPNVSNVKIISAPSDVFFVLNNGDVMRSHFGAPQLIQSTGHVFNSIVSVKNQSFCIDTIDNMIECSTNSSNLGQAWDIIIPKPTNVIDVVAGRDGTLRKRTDDLINNRTNFSETMKVCILTSTGAVSCMESTGTCSTSIGSSCYVNSFQPSVFSQMVGLASGVRALSQSMNPMCAILNDNSAKCWGNDLYNQFGDLKVTNSNIPTDLSGWYKAVSGETRLIKNDALINIPTAPANIITNVNRVNADGSVNVTLSWTPSASNITDSSINYRIYGTPVGNSIFYRNQINQSSSNSSVSFDVPDYSYYSFKIIAESSKAANINPTDYYSQIMAIPQIKPSIVSVSTNSDGSISLIPDNNTILNNYILKTIPAAWNSSNGIDFYYNFGLSYIIKMYNEQGQLLSTNTLEKNAGMLWTPPSYGLMSGDIKWDGVNSFILSNIINSGNIYFTITMVNNAGIGQEGFPSNIINYQLPAPVIVSVSEQASGSVFLTPDSLFSPNATNSYFSKLYQNGGIITIKSYDDTGAIIATNTLNDGSLAWNGTNYVLSKTNYSGNISYTISIGNGTVASPESPKTTAIAYVPPTIDLANASYNTEIQPQLTWMLATDSNNNNQLTYLDMTSQDGTFIPTALDSNLWASLGKVFVDSNSNVLTDVPTGFYSTTNSGASPKTSGIIPMTVNDNSIIQSFYSDDGSANMVIQVYAIGISQIDWDCNDAIMDPTGSCDVPANFIVSTVNLAATYHNKTYFEAFIPGIGNKLVAIVPNVNTLSGSDYSAKIMNGTCVYGALSSANALAISPYGDICTVDSTLVIELPNAMVDSYGGFFFNSSLYTNMWRDY